jgi:hypothetical protein
MRAYVFSCCTTGLRGIRCQQAARNRVLYNCDLALVLIQRTLLACFLLQATDREAKKLADKERQAMEKALR